MSGSFIGFLSDYGLEDELVGVCHGVIARRCPSARVIDITHAVPRHDVRAGALRLRHAVNFMPAAVHLAVVDPGVGASGEQARRAVALRAAADGHLLVGPDNGLLLPAAEALGGIAEAVDIGRSRERLTPVSATFHGRDVFAPVAAALADGVPLRDLGEPLDPASLRRLKLPRAEALDGALRAHVIDVDRFGNIALDATAQQLEQVGLCAGRALRIETARIEGKTARRGRTFADAPAGELVLYEDSREAVAIAVNRGSAAQTLGLGRDDELLLRPA